MPIKKKICNANGKRLKGYLVQICKYPTKFQAAAQANLVNEEQRIICNKTMYRSQQRVLQELKPRR